MGARTTITLLPQVEAIRRCLRIPSTGVVRTKIGPLRRPYQSRLSGSELRRLFNPLRKYMDPCRDRFKDKCKDSSMRTLPGTTSRIRCPHLRGARKPLSTNPTRAVVGTDKWLPHPCSSHKRFSFPLSLIHYTLDSRPSLTCLLTIIGFFVRFVSLGTCNPLHQPLTRARNLSKPRNLKWTALLPMDLPGCQRLLSNISAPLWTTRFCLPFHWIPQAGQRAASLHSSLRARHWKPSVDSFSIQRARPGPCHQISGSGRNHSPFIAVSFSLLLCPWGLLGEPGCFVMIFDELFTSLLFVFRVATPDWDQKTGPVMFPYTAWRISLHDCSW